MSNMLTLSLPVAHQDRRRFIRVAPTTMAESEQAQLEVLINNTPCYLPLLDISEVGVSLSIPNELQTQQEVMSWTLRNQFACVLHLPCPVVSRLCLQALIRQKRDGFLGLEFRHLKPIHRKLIRGYICSQMREVSFTKRWRYRLGLVL